MTSLQSTKNSIQGITKFVVLLVCMLISGQWLFAQGFNVKDLRIDIKISKDGYFDVTEDYEVDFYQQKHGLFRKIPLKYNVAGENGRVESHKITISKVSVDGWEYSKTRDWGSDMFGLKIGDKDKYVFGLQHYTIKYRVKGAFLYTPDTTAIFYWNLIGKEWDTEFENVRFNVQLEDSLPLTNRDYFVYSGYQGDTSNNVTLKYKDGLLSGKANAALKGGEDVTVLIYLPRDYIRKPTKWEALWQEWGWTLFPFFLTLLFYIIWRTYGKDTKIIKTVSFQPPAGIDPAMAGFLINDKSDSSDLTALIPHWGAYGYLTMQLKEKEGWFSRGDTILHKVKDLPVDAPLYERVFFNGLFKTGNTVYVSSLRENFYTTMDSAKRSLKDAAMQAGYYTKESRRAMYGSGCGFLVLGGAGTFLVFTLFGILPGIVSGIVTLILLSLTPLIIKKSSKGDEALRDIEGFKLFIEKAEKNKLEVLLKEDPTYFEKTLGYALAFGMVRKWAKKFEGLNLQPPTWYDSGSGWTAFSAYAFANSFNSTMSSVQSTMVSTPSRDSGGSSSGGGFSGGGSSGGGFGGGGGGSW